MFIKKQGNVHHISTTFDDVALVMLMANVAQAHAATDLNGEEMAVLDALRRANQQLADAPLEDVQSYLQNLSPEQLTGLVSNTKGILHEMEFVRIENDDGDSVYASMHEATNHPDYDVVMTDSETGDSWEVQLKATDSPSYVEDWINNHPDGEILVTSELAEKLGLPDSGLSNEELTVQVEDFLDKAIAVDSAGNSDLWLAVPALGVVSVSIIVVGLWRRYKKKEIDLPTFKKLAAMATGVKAAYIAGIVALLAIPVVGQVTGAALVARALLNLDKLRQAKFLPA